MSYTVQSLLIMGLLASFLIVLVNSAFWILRATGRVLYIQSFTFFPPTFHGITYHHEGKRVTDWAIDRVEILFHIPVPWNPRLATVIARDLSYVKGREHAVNVEAVSLVFWFLPVFFRFSSGTVITTKLEGFVVDTVNSTTEAWWVKAIRRNITETIFQGETIRLHDLKTKVWLYEPVVPTSQACDLDSGDMGESTEDETEDETEAVEPEREGHCLEDYSKKKYSRGSYAPAREVEDIEETEGIEEEEPDKNVLRHAAAEYREGSDETEARARIYANNWLIHNHRNERVYTFGTVNAEFRRPWGALPLGVETKEPAVEGKLESPPGSLVLKATDSRWTKLPRTYTSERYFKAGTITQLALSLLSLPRYMKRIFTDPLSIIDIEVTDAQLTFREFRVRDAELFVHGLNAAKAKYSEMSDGTKQAISDWTWDIFCDGVRMAFA